jgi:hypothetical protein
MCYMPVNFAITELVTTRVYKKYGATRCWQFFDVRALAMLQALRDYLNCPVIVTSGLRMAGDKSYTVKSRHCGFAFDVVCKLYTAAELRKIIFDHQDLFPYICGIEMGVDWLHFDTRNAVPNYLGQFYCFGEGDKI